MSITCGNAVIDGIILNKRGNYSSGNLRDGPYAGKTEEE